MMSKVSILEPTNLGEAMEFAKQISSSAWFLNNIKATQLIP